MDSLGIHLLPRLDIISRPLTDNDEEGRKEGERAESKQNEKKKKNELQRLDS
jgi:hypothetical protein